VPALSGEALICTWQLGFCRVTSAVALYLLSCLDTAFTTREEAVSSELIFRIPLPSIKVFRLVCPETLHATSLL
jgi:hypothetical protein